MSESSIDDMACDIDLTKGRMVKGAGWMVSMHWSLWLIGVVNIVIIARLLAPGYFGFIVMAMIIVVFLTEISEKNVAIALIRKPDAGRDDYNSDWTIKILIGALLTIILTSLVSLIVNLMATHASKSCCKSSCTVAR